MSGWLEGKVTLVTGGGSGIGRASALTFARVGAKVIVADMVIEGGEETVHMIRVTGGEATFVKVDVSKAIEVEALIKKALGTFGRLDCAHNNAGILGDLAPTAECTEENWDRLINTNLKGIWLCMKYEIPQMLKQNGGAIVNTSSIIGVVGWPGRPAYVASKHGVAGLTKAAALEYAKAGIRINAVLPGPIRTPMTLNVTGGDPEAELKRYTSTIPLGRMGTPEDVAEAVVWLCSDAASFVTGHTMAVDGGWIAQ